MVVRLTRKWTTAADLLAELGGIAASRVRLDPAPGTATEKDLLRLQKKDGKLYELVDGTLVEKAVGYEEGSLGSWIAHKLNLYLDGNNIGEVNGADTTMRLRRRLVRLPDVSFVTWERLDAAMGHSESRTVPDLAPNLAVEVLSRRNTPAEMARKRREYFAAGTELVWEVDPKTLTIAVYTSPEDVVTLRVGGVLTGGIVLPGFSIPVKELFERRKRPVRNPRPPKKN